MTDHGPITHSGGSPDDQTSHGSEESHGHGGIGKYIAVFVLIIE